MDGSVARGRDKFRVGPVMVADSFDFDYVSVQKRSRNSVQETPTLSEMHWHVNCFSLLADDRYSSGHEGKRPPPDQNP